MASKVLFSYEDLLQTPDDGKRYEIVEGDLLLTAAPIAKHQFALLMLMEFLVEAYRSGYGELWVAPFQVYFDEHNVVEPDLLFVRTERLSIVTERDVRGAPDLVVEILSPSTSDRDLGVKFHMYARFGVSHYWVVDPEAQIVRAFELRDGDYGKARILDGDDLLSCPLFPEFSIPVHRLFR